ncbi:MAG: ATP-dependent DNA helicase RecG [Phycisphaeraceae bacterium]|nr:MAG: ATP-dependent DNA helicase RecG [Phycisphaeraceae bacterium]
MAAPNKPDRIQNPSMNGPAPRAVFSCAPAAGEERRILIRMTAPASGAILLTTAIEAVPGVKAAHARAFRRLGIPAVAHLLRHLPARHELEAEETTIDQLKPGEIITARGEVTDTRVAGRYGKQRFEAVLIDHTGRLDLVWFNGGFLRKQITPGMRLRVQGRSRQYGANLQIANPIWERIDAAVEEPGRRSRRLRPVYPASEDLPSRTIEQTIEKILDDALALIDDHLPPDFRAERELPELREAYRMIHRPGSDEEVREARRRLVFDELLLLQLGVQMKRAHLRRALEAPPLRWSEQIDKKIRGRLPFTLTKGQEEAIGEIVADLRKPTPATRLIQGDVGSGKTVVALYAMLMAVASQRQAALMAPTELLAEQHFLTITELLHGSDVRLALLTGSMAPPDRESVHRAIEAGDIDIVVGTHALLSESVRFHALGVAVIDEQHRFGVHQRAGLRGKAGVGESGKPLAPHTLVMTATPIPRTLALTVFGDLDVSTIHGLPPGRTPVKTRAVGFDKTDEVYDYVRTRLDAGEQAYVVVPTIEEGAGGLRDVRSTVKRLEEGAFAGKRVAGLHGQLKRATREQIMGRFRAGLIDALVATTVIEVGVDVPNASVMVIEHAERFGLAQLHQLRGRVGRGSKKSLCVLIGEAKTSDAEARMKAVASTSDGFKLAEKDLELRGPGEMLGSKQSGLAPFRVAEFPRDIDLLLMARRDAAKWIERSPALEAPEETLLRKRLLKEHGETLGLADVA